MSTAIGFGEQMPQENASNTGASFCGEHIGVLMT
jgi:hypothetical protein